jgi:hypothetical protein
MRKMGNKDTELDLDASFLVALRAKNKCGLNKSERTTIFNILILVRLILCVNCKKNMKNLKKLGQCS